ncbi:MAG: hypothetical protein U0931_11860 [Vulcanimicrobiota bacterium]
MKEKRAVSLAETIVALFLLTGVVLVIVTLLHTMLRYGQRVELQSLAALAADQRIEQIRAWSRRKTGVTYNFENLITTYDGSVTSDPQFPDLQLTTEARWQPLDSPGSALEQPYADKRRLNTSAVLLRVRASWQSRTLARNLVVTSLIAAPAVRPKPTLTITQVNGGSPIAALNQAVFRAQAEDVDSRPLPDLSYHWNILPETGNASVFLQRRDTSEARVVNQVRRPDGTFAPASGSCQLQARASYRGQELTGVFSVSLSP